MTATDVIYARVVQPREGARARSRCPQQGVFFSYKEGGGDAPLLQGSHSGVCSRDSFAKFHCSVDFRYRDAEVLEKSVPAKKFSDSRCLHCIGFRSIVWGKGVTILLPYSLTGRDLFGLEQRLRFFFFFNRPRLKITHGSTDVAIQQLCERLILSNNLNNLNY